MIHDPEVPQASGDTLSEFANRVIDGIVSAGSRLLELPLSVLLLAAGLVVVALLLAIGRLGRNSAHPRLLRALRFAVVAAVVVATLFVVDHRVALLQNEIDRLRERMQDGTAALLERMAEPGVHRTDRLFDTRATETALKQRFGAVRIRTLICNDAVDLVQVHIDRPLERAFVAVVDLTDPRLEIEIGATLDHKTMTSDFARRTGCTVAINGEAGNSPRPRCGLGPWTGHLVRDGEVLLTEQAGNPRPFVAFGAHNRATFHASTASDRAVPEGSRNVIWGRVDSIVDGVVQTEDFRWNQPRTVIGIDRAGTRLFLMVVDGRQMDASWGFTRAEAGDFLEAFGAWGSMLCDEGGSTCMFVKAFGGLVNVPSDDRGKERPTYTHFGVRIADRDGR